MGDQAESGARAVHLSAEELQGVIRRLKRARGQLGGVIAMMEESRDCREVVTQLAAVAKAVDRAGFLMLSLGMRKCLTDPDATDGDAEAIEKLFLSLA